MALFGLLTLGRIIARVDQNGLLRSHARVGESDSAHNGAIRLTLAVENHRSKRPNNDLYIKPQRPILNIEVVITAPVCN